MQTEKLRLFLSVVILTITLSCSNPEKDLEKASAQNTIEAYNAIIEKYPNSEYAKKAKKGIEDIVYLQKHPLKDQGFDHLLLLDDEYTMQCGDEKLPVRALRVEKPTIITYDDFKSKFNWDGKEKLFRIKSSESNQFSGFGINPEGERVLHGSLCLGNLQLTGPIILKSGGMLFQTNSELIHVAPENKK